MRLLWRLLRERVGAPPAGPNASRDLPAGARHYRAFVGPPDRYDLIAALQFNLLTTLGLREDHYLLDIGCGSLRGGRLFIPYLLPGRYFGLEPERWLVEEGIRWEIGRDLVRIKKPVFRHDRDFRLTAFGAKFDFLLAQSIFSHASPPQIERCLEQAREVMKPGALFAATYVIGEADYEGEAWVYPECVRYRPERLELLARRASLECVHVDWPHPRQTWVVFVHRGEERAIPAHLRQLRPSALR